MYMILVPLTKNSALKYQEASINVTPIRDKSESEDLLKCEYFEKNFYHLR